MATPATAPPDTPDFEGPGTPVRRGGGGGTDVVVENVVPFTGKSVKLAVVGQLNVSVGWIHVLGQLVVFVAPKGQITTANVGAVRFVVCVSHFGPAGSVGTGGGSVLTLGAGLVVAGEVD